MTCCQVAGSAFTKNYISRSMVFVRGLDKHFAGRWIGRRGPTEWPPRSPNLRP